LELPLPPGVAPAAPLPAGALLPEAAPAEPEPGPPAIAVLPAFSPPFRPTPGWGDWLRPPASLVPLPDVPGNTSPPEDPVCGAEPAIPEGPPGGPSGATGFELMVALPVPGLPGAFGLLSACLLHPPSASAHAAAKLATTQVRLFMA
jgi:hypothetical protein